MFDCLCLSVHRVSFVMQVKCRTSLFSIRHVWADRLCIPNRSMLECAAANLSIRCGCPLASAILSASLRDCRTAHDSTKWNDAIPNLNSVELALVSACTNLRPIQWCPADEIHSEIMKIELNWSRMRNEHSPEQKCNRVHWIWCNRWLRALCIRQPMMLCSLFRANDRCLGKTYQHLVQFVCIAYYPVRWFWQRFLDAPTYTANAIYSKWCHTSDRFRRQAIDTIPDMQTMEWNRDDSFSTNLTVA